MKLFRAEAVTNSLLSGEPRRARSTMRLPVNVPFVLDNLWEYLRPAHMPCRRHAIFASPSPALAMQSASTADKGLGIGVYEIEFTGTAKLAQLQVKDAKFHADIKTIVGKLPNLIDKRATDTASRHALAPLLLPGGTKQSWSTLVAGSREVAALVEDMTSLSTFWSDASSSVTLADGEVFFELGEGSSYLPKNLMRTAEAAAQ